MSAYAEQNVAAFLKDNGIRPYAHWSAARQALDTLNFIKLLALAKGPLAHYAEVSTVRGVLACWAEEESGYKKGVKYATAVNW